MYFPLVFVIFGYPSKGREGDSEGVPQKGGCRGGPDGILRARQGAVRGAAVIHKEH